MANSVEELINEIQQGIINIDEIKKFYQKELIDNNDGTWSVAKGNIGLFDAVLEEVVANRMVVHGDATTNKIVYLGKNTDLARFDRFTKATEAAEYIRSQMASALAHCGSIEHLKEQNQYARDVRWALGISDEELQNKMAELLRSGRNLNNDSRWDAIAEKQEILSRKDKKILKRIKESERESFDTELYAAALRELTIEKAEKAYQKAGAQRASGTVDLSDPEIVLRSMLQGKDVLPGFGDDEQTQSSTIDDFVNDLKELGRQDVPTVIYEHLELNMPPEKQVSEVTDGRYDIMKLQTSVREGCSSERAEKFRQIINNPKYKNIDFTAKTDKGNQNITLADTAFEFVSIYAKNQAKSRIEEIIDEKKQEKKDNNKARNPEELSQIYNSEQMKETLGVELPEEKDGSSKPYYDGISKCPYRALALAMKMINQLARMMCASFQKTIGAGGFYKTLTQDEYNKETGFGQRIQERGNDLTWFFFGGEYENKDTKKIKSIAPSSFVGNIPGNNDSIFNQLCEALNIEPKTEVLKDLILKQPGRVEDALGYVKGLSQTYLEWTSKNGIDAQEEAIVQEEGDAARIRAAELQIADKAASNETKNGGPRRYLAKTLLDNLQRARAKGDAKEIKGCEDELIKNFGQQTNTQELKDVTNINIMFNDIEICRLSIGASNLVSRDIKYLKDINEIYEALSSGDRDQVISDLGLLSDKDCRDFLDNFFAAGDGSGMQEIVNLLHKKTSLWKYSKKIDNSNASDEDKNAYLNGTLDDEGYKRLRNAGIFTQEDEDFIKIITDPNYVDKGMPPHYKGGDKGIPQPAQTLPIPFEEKIKAIKKAFSTNKDDALKGLVSYIGGGRTADADTKEFSDKIVNGTLKNFDENAELTPELVHEFAEITREIRQEAIQAVQNHERTTGGTTTGK